MLYIPWRNDRNDTNNNEYMFMYASNLNLTIQNRQLFDSRDQSSIQEAINTLEDLDTDDLNFGGIAYGVIKNNEGAVVIEDTDIVLDSLANDKACIVDPNDDSETKSAGEFINIPNSKMRGGMPSTLHCFKIMMQLSM